MESNLKRRHLNDFQKADLAIPLLEIEKELAKKRISEGGKGVKVSPNDERLNTNKKVAKQTGLSSRTLERTKKVIELSLEELKQLFIIFKY